MHQPLNDDNYVDVAETAMRALIDNKAVKGAGDEKLTSSKLRTILSMTADIYNRIKSGTRMSLMMKSSSLCSICVSAVFMRPDGMT